MYVTQDNFGASARNSPSSRMLHTESELRELGLISRNFQMNSTTRESQSDLEYPNQWVETRNLKQLGRDNSGSTIKTNIQNKRYLEIVKTLIQPDHIWKLLKWINSLSERQMKSLRLLNTINQSGKKIFKLNKNDSAMRLTEMSSERDQDPGLKTLQSSPSRILAFGGQFQKPINTQSQVSLEQLDLKNLDAKQAKQYYRQMQTQTSYASIFGAGKTQAQNFKILKEKKFRQQELSKYFKPQAAKQLEEWLLVNDDEGFLQRAFVGISEMHTVIKNLEAPVTTNKNFYSGVQVNQKVPRFDKLTMNVKYAKEFRAKSLGRPDPKSNFRQASEISNILYKNYRRAFEGPQEDVKKYKLKFMKGQDFNITGYWEKTPKHEDHETTYANTNRGGQLKSPAYKAKIIDKEYTSLANAGAIPDPLTVVKMQNRRNNFSTDLKKMRGKNFMYTGDNWNTQQGRESFARYRMANRSPDDQSGQTHW